MCKHTRHPSQEPTTEGSSARHLGCTPSFVQPTSLCYNFQLELGCDCLVSAQTESAHICQKTPGPCYLWVFSQVWRTLFPLCLKLPCVPWLDHIHSHTYPGISPLQSCTWHTLWGTQKAIFSGTQHSAVMSCKCRILSNITIVIEGPCLKSSWIWAWFSTNTLKYSQKNPVSYF